MKVFKICTTAYREEDFYLLSDLTEDQIFKVINPIVMAERDGEEDYDNEQLLEALRNKYPKKRIEMFDEFDEIIF